MTSRVTRLLALQEVDSLRDRSSARLARVAAALLSDSAVAGARRSLTEAESLLADIDPRLRGASRDRDAAKAHLDREQAKLYSGAIRAPKELQSFQRETEALRRHLADLDDKVLELMLAHDDAETRVTSARANVAALQAKAEEEAQGLRKEQARLTAELRELDGRRERIAGGVPAADLEVYERLRGAKGGRAVSRLRGGECEACGMQLPRQLVDQAVSSYGLVPCPNCGRILAV